MTRSVDEMLASLPAHCFRGNGDFEPKLTFAERCGVLALYQTGVSVEQLAAAFKFNRRTVRHITSHDSKKYRSVRNEVLRLGEFDFRKQYITETLVHKVHDAAGKAEIKQTMAEYDASAGNRTSAPNPRASTAAGISMYQGSYDFVHRIEVKWHEANTCNGAEHPAGWYACDLDDGDGTFWEGDPEVHSHFTSAKALEWFKREHP